MRRLFVAEGTMRVRAFFYAPSEDQAPAHIERVFDSEQADGVYVWTTDKIEEVTASGVVDPEATMHLAVEPEPKTGRQWIARFDEAQEARARALHDEAMLRNQLKLFSTE